MEAGKAHQLSKSDKRIKGFFQQSKKDNNMQVVVI